jgi:hypothetical protein
MCNDIDCNEVQVYDGHDSKGANRTRRWILRLTGGRSITIGHNIYVADDDLNSAGFVQTDALAHEMTHVGQYEDWWPLRYTLQGGGTQLYNSAANLVGGNDPAYQVGLPMTHNWTQYGMEQQATIVERCQQGLAVYCANSPYTFPTGP